MGRILEIYRDVYKLAKVTKLNSGSTHSLFYFPVWEVLVTITLVPVLHGCTPVLPADGVFAATGVAVKTAVLSEAQTGIETLDILVFNDDMMQRLDCWQRFEDVSSDIFDTGSMSGKKVFFGCANATFGPEKWRPIGSLSGLYDIKADLEREKRGTPLMTGHLRCDAGSKGQTLKLKRLSGEVVLNSISCDFRGKPYDGKKITDIKVYLTNVNASCSICADGSVMPERVINSGRLSEHDLEQFNEPDIICQDMEYDIDKEVKYPYIRLLAYPNNSETESPGTPFTRLVIEGRIQGELWYWPIDINRNSPAPGISRNCSYIYDVTITAKGSKDPDIPVSFKEAVIKYEIEGWREKEDYTVSF